MAQLQKVCDGSEVEGMPGYKSERKRVWAARPAIHAKGIMVGETADKA
jgi:hypothetical protein